MPLFFAKRPSSIISRSNSLRRTPIYETRLFFSEYVMTFDEFARCSPQTME